MIEAIGESDKSDVIHVHIMSFPLQIECAMCDAVGDWIYAVPYYCGPVAEAAAKAAIAVCANRVTIGGRAGTIL